MKKQYISLTLGLLAFLLVLGLLGGWENDAWDKLPEPTQIVEVQSR